MWRFPRVAIVSQDVPVAYLSLMDGGLSLVIRARDETRERGPPYPAPRYLQRGVTVLTHLRCASDRFFHNGNRKEEKRKSP